MVTNYMDSIPKARLGRGERTTSCSRKRRLGGRGAVQGCPFDDYYAIYRLRIIDTHT